MKKSLIPLLILSFLSNSSLANEKNCDGDGFCDNQTPAGNQGFASRAQIRFDDTIPPNTEYRTQDEINKPVTSNSKINFTKKTKKPICDDKIVGDIGLPFRISVDGNPLELNDLSNSADVTRCKDLNLQKADIQIRYDSLSTTPTLNVIALPNSAIVNEDVIFKTYSNYSSFIKRLEVRLFNEEQSVQSKPISIIKIDKNNQTDTKWKVPSNISANRIKFVLRVYDENNNFDETAPKFLNIIDKHRMLDDKENSVRESLVGYGENHREVKNIQAQGGTVTINGTNLAKGTTVWAMDSVVPVDSNGKFASQQIMPSGTHDVKVTTKAANGVTGEFSRSLYIPVNDWFYVAQGDLTLGQNNVKGPTQLANDYPNKHYRRGVYSDGRLAFYAKGKVKDGWLLTASADTKEQPLKNLFSNFDEKDPHYLLRRLDPYAYYPVYGDDSTTIEDAPTEGKFYVRLEKDNSHIMWGSFQTKINGTDLLNYSRSLYGGNAEYKSKESTKFGERVTEVQGFAADPGSVSSLEEFRGTGGSLYYLQQQDIVVGSERIRIEVRDKDSGIVIKTQNLVFGQDYEINYIQGRVILREALASTANAGANNLIITHTLSGNPAYLIAGYEYTPGITAMSNLTKGGRVSHWVNDNLKLGITGYQQDSVGSKQELSGADVTLRYAPSTYVKLEAGRSIGPGSGSQSSINGGFNFNQIPQTITNNITANAYRAETGLDFAELSGGTVSGNMSGYFIVRENGYSSPGQLTNEEVRQAGFLTQLPVTEKLSLNGKVDIKKARNTGDVQSGEAIANYSLTDENSVSLALRVDKRDSILSAGKSSVLAREVGTRTDVGLKVTHAPLKEDGTKERYELFAIAQGTISRDDTRSLNNRGGAGAKYELNDKISLTGEATGGNGGLGGKAGIEYRATDRTTYYSNYLIDNERSDTGYRGRNSNLATGVKTRYSDTLSVFGEQRYQRYDQGPAGLIHSFGLDLAASDQWTWGGRFETGKLADSISGDLRRTALSISPGYHNNDVKYGGTLEWRQENSNLTGRRVSWLIKNKLAYQTTPDWRMITGLDLAFSRSDISSILNANYKQFNFGYAYRPVLNDRFNALVKYIYLDDHASPGQFSADRNTLAKTYQQRSQIIAADSIYDFTPRLSVGGKVGYRWGQLRDNDVADPKWFTSNAWLAIVRADYHVVKEWDISGELRYLRVVQAKDAKYGPLVGVYRHFNDNVKLGVGYNFTRFSDDLTDLSYRSHGFFVNLLAKF